MKGICLFHCTIHFTFQTFPFFGVEPTILNEHGEELEGEAEGYLVSFFSVLHNFIHQFFQPKQTAAHIHTLERGKRNDTFAGYKLEICCLYNKNMYELWLNLNCKVTETERFCILWFKQ